MIGKRIGSIIVCLALLITCLSSCDVVGGLIGGGQINPDKYQATVRIAFATIDGKMLDAIDAMSSSSVIMADGDNISVHTTAKGESTSVDNSYILVDGMLYHHLLIVSGVYNAESMRLAVVEDQDLDSIIAKAGTGADVGIADFETSEMFVEGGLDVFSCSDITAEAKESLEAILTSDFAAIGATAVIKEAYYTLEMKDGVEMGSTLSVSLEINMNGELYEVTMHTYTDYNYRANVSIAPPADADSYKMVAYDEIIK